jgi:hypothetical protein
LSTVVNAGIRLAHTDAAREARHRPLVQIIAAREYHRDAALLENFSERETDLAVQIDVEHRHVEITFLRRLLGAVKRPDNLHIPGAHREEHVLSV